MRIFSTSNCKLIGTIAYFIVMHTDKEFILRILQLSNFVLRSKVKFYIVKSFVV